MDNSQDREEWRRERSLLALGRAMRGDDDAPPSRSLLAIADRDDGTEGRLDARARHSLARERRQALEPDGAAIDVEFRPLPASLRHGDAPFARGPAGTEVPSRAAPQDLAGSAPPRRRLSWRLAATTTVLGTCLGAAIAFSLPARYQATAELSLGSDGAGRIAAGALDSQVRVLTSGMVLTKVVDRLNLASDPEFNGKDGGTGLAGLLHAVLMRSDTVADAGHRQAVAVDHLAGTLSVAPAHAGTIAVMATTGNGEKSALVANAVADAFVEVYGQDRSGAAADGNGASNARPDNATPLAAARRQLGAFAAARGLGDLADDPDRIAGILKLDEDLAEARSRTEDLNAKVASLRSAGIATAAAGLPREFETGAIEALRAQYLDLKQQADSAAVKLGPRNPELLGIEAQLAGARDRLSAELRRIVAAQQAALKQAVETEQGYAARLAKTGLTGEDIVALHNLQQAVAAAEVDRQTTTASIPANAAGGGGQGVHVVSRAEAPLQPSGPSHLLLTLAGSVLGLFAGLGIGVLRGGSGRDNIEADKEAPEAGENRPEDVDARKRNAGFEDWHDADYLPDDPAVAPSWPVDAGQWPAELPVAIPARQAGSPDFTAIPDPMETAMYPVYPDQSYPQARQPQGQPQWVQPADYPPYPPQPQMQPPMQQAVQYYPPSYPQHAYPQAWQPAPPMSAYPQSAPAYAAQYYPPQPAFPYPPQDAGSPFDRGALDEIRASLQEFREALRDLAESRSRRRIF